MYEGIFYLYIEIVAQAAGEGREEGGGGAGWRVRPKESLSFQLAKIRLG